MVTSDLDLSDLWNGRNWLSGDEPRMPEVQGGDVMPDENTPDTEQVKAIAAELNHGGYAVAIVQAHEGGPWTASISMNIPDAPPLASATADTQLAALNAAVAKLREAGLS